MNTSNQLEEPPLWIAIVTYINFVVLYIFGYLRDVLRLVGLEKHREARDHPTIEFVPLFKNFESFYTRNVYFRVRDCFSRPVSSMPGVQMTLKTRYSDDYNWSFKHADEHKEVINIGSYNYLGFAENTGKCVDDVRDCIDKYGMAQCSSSHEIGYTSFHRELERRVASFLGTEDAVVFSMGFACNSTNISCLVGKGCLILSDELSHASIVLGCRLSGATIKVFKHCDMIDLENKLRQAIIDGNTRMRRQWRKILIVVEGIYSMEGTICPLQKLIELKRKYRAYLFVDEAHSIGAIGKRGRGVTDFLGCNPHHVDVLMGTFTKSFNSCGGYLAGSRDVMNHIRRHSHSMAYGQNMSVPIMQQIISVIDEVEHSALEGDNRMMRLADNTRYLRSGLRKLRFIVYGNEDSPVVPVMLFATTKIGAFNREMMARGVAVVTVGFPATPLSLGRVRFCVSAGHTKEMLDQVLKACAEVGDLLNLRVSCCSEGLL